MSWEFTPFTIPLLLALLGNLAIVGLVALKLYRHGVDALGGTFLLHEISLLFFLPPYLFMLSATTHDGALFWFQFMHVGVALVPILWVCFVVVYVDRLALLTPARLVALWAVPALTILLALTNGPLLGELHSLVWTDTRLVEMGGFLLLGWAFGPWFLVAIGYAYTVVSGGIYLLLEDITRARHTHRRRQTVALLIAVSATFVVQIIYMSAALIQGDVWGLHAVIDFTPIALAVKSVAYWFAIYQYDFLDLRPVARETAVETMDDSYLVVDAAGRIVDRNPAASLLVGDGDVIGERADAALETDSELLPASGNGESAGQVGLLGGEAEADVAIQTGRGQRTLNVKRWPIRDDIDDQLLGSIIIGRDVTERTRRERELLRYRSLVESAADPMLVRDEGGTIVLLNEAMATHLGSEKAAVLETPATEWLGEETTKREQETIAALLESGERWGRYETTEVAADGDTRHFEVTVGVIRDDGAFTGTVATMRDITERTERKRELEARQTELERQNERLDRFASSISHDLRNPLGIAETYLNFAEESGDEADFAAVREAHERMDRMIDGLLQLARAGNAVDEREPLAIERLAADAWDHVETGESTLDVRADLTVEGHRESLLHVFENLFRNAIEHNDRPVAVEVGQLTEDGHAAGLYVADDGVGIPPAERETVLAFGHSTGEAGTGFGLGIVTDIVRSHGWDLAVTGSETGGAKFELRCLEGDIRVSQ